jgi:hypothetical protein
MTTNDNTPETYEERRQRLAAEYLRRVMGL